MSALQHAAPPESYVARLAREKRERQARFAAKAYAPGPKVVEIKEAPISDTSIPVVACNGQVVMISGAEVQAVRILFDPVSKTAGVARIKAEVCRRFHVTKNDLISGRREFNVAMARHVAMYLCKTLTSKSMPAIGREFNGCDHTTVMHAIKKIERLISTSDTIREHVEVLTKRIKGEAVE